MHEAGKRSWRQADTYGKLQATRVTGWRLRQAYSRLRGPACMPMRGLGLLLAERLATGLAGEALPLGLWASGDAGHRPGDRPSSGLHELQLMSATFCKS